jgi:hypothetical protein
VQQGMNRELGFKVEFFFNLGGDNTSFREKGFYPHNGDGERFEFGRNLF